MGQTVTDLPDNATPLELESADKLEQPATYIDPVESEFENVASVTEPEIEVTAQGNVGKDPKPEMDTKTSVPEPGSVTLNSEEVFQLNHFLASSRFTLSDFEHLGPVFKKLNTPTRGGWWGWGLMDRM